MWRISAAPKWNGAYALVRDWSLVESFSQNGLADGAYRYKVETSTGATGPNGTAGAAGATGSTGPRGVIQVVTATAVKNQNQGRRSR